MNISGDLDPWRGETGKPRQLKKQYWTKHQIVTLEEIKVFVDYEIHGAKKLPKADENLMLFYY